VADIKNQKLKVGKMRNFQEFSQLSWRGCNMSAQLQYLTVSPAAICQSPCSMCRVSSAAICHSGVSAQLQICHNGVSAQLQYRACQLSCNMWRVSSAAICHSGMSVQLHICHSGVSAQLQYVACQLSCNVSAQLQYVSSAQLHCVGSGAICQLSSIAMCSSAQLQCVGSGAVCELSCNMSAT